MFLFLTMFGRIGNRRFSMIFYIAVDEDKRMLGYSLKQTSMFSNRVEGEIPDGYYEDYIYRDKAEDLIYSPDEERKKKREDEIAKKECHGGLDSTDWHSAQIMEDLLDILEVEIPTTLEEMIEIITALINWRKDSAEKFNEMIEQRKEWREKLREIEEDELSN